MLNGGILCAAPETRHGRRAHRLVYLIREKGVQHVVENMHTLGTLAADVLPRPPSRGRLQGPR